MERDPLRNAFVGLASGVWSSLSGCVRYSSRKGWLNSTQLGARVISVGNIQVGGAGKTPLVALISNEAIHRGLVTCILSRGYKSKWESEGGVILPDSDPVDAALCGDEVALLHELAPKAYIGVGANRIKQFQTVKNQASSPIDLVILDDGFQNWRIKKDVEIVALTSQKPSQILFRDFEGALKYADLLVWTKGEIRPASWSKPMVVVEYQLPPPSSSTSYWLVTGVADGGSVKNLALRSGYQVSRHLQYSDHAGYCLDSVRKILEQAAKNQAQVLITGKDWVKWRSLNITRAEVTVLEPVVHFNEGKEYWAQILWGK